MNYILTDISHIKTSLLPLTYFRPVGEIRCGILTIKEKWEKHLKTSISHLTEEYLQEKFPVRYQKDNIYINSALFPDQQLIASIEQLQPGEVLVSNHLTLAFRTGKADWKTTQQFKGKIIEYPYKIDGVLNIYEIFLKNGEQILLDFSLITKERKSFPVSTTNTVIGDFPIFIEEGVKMEACIINTESGPVYLGKNSVILEGSLIRGPFASLEHSVVKMGAKIYGGTTIGPYTKVGGEIKDTVFFGYANKAHDGYLGDSVISEWCNLGAGTNNSNLKNNYSTVKLWNYLSRDFEDTGLQFCGLIMGDHSKCGIATMFNTGTVVGVSSNIFGGNYQPKFFPSFKWGGQKQTDYFYDKAVEVAKTVYKRRQKHFDKKEEDLFKSVYELTKKEII